MSRYTKKQLKRRAVVRKKAEKLKTKSGHKKRTKFDPFPERRD